MTFKQITWRSLGEIMHEVWMKAWRHIKTIYFQKNIPISFYCFHYLTALPHFLAIALTQ